jgi:hypothetical protein
VSLHNILTHLRDAQGMLSFRINLMLDQDEPVLESLTVFEWANREEADSQAIGEVLETYQVYRQELVTRLKEVPLADWWRIGQHAEISPVTLRQQASYFAMHEFTHLPQIKRLRRVP